jgi:hypothetical protein
MQSRQNSHGSSEVFHLQKSSIQFPLLKQVFPSILPSKVRSQIDSFTPLAMALVSALVEDIKTVFCLFDAHVMGPPTDLNTTYQCSPS